MQVDTVSAEVDPYLPASQGPVQAAVGSPLTAPYRPALQLVHVPAPVKLYLPGGQMLAVGVVDPAAQAYPAVQFPLHADEFRPDTAPYLPAGHSPLHAARAMGAVAP